ncbi:hypothetical protein WQQ_04310 [Hydrocarboniphaga effusa AP103]|uniref:Uncharacterized protein n=1 Tax=Hydrocarboniphaga effusa AP103 TaxID=1172194 RepID=I7ZEH2_9GAMM|nr:hypothetical protein WQQ_04310 [Hydrocarboniphaga effusa AP103]
MASRAGIALGAAMEAELEVVMTQILPKFASALADGPPDRSRRAS